MNDKSEHLSTTLPDSLLGFNGERIDAASGGYHLGNGYRLYNPALRRFTTPDSMSPFSAGGINPYTYCAGDPVNHTDPTGHLPVRKKLGQGLDGVEDIATDGAAVPEQAVLHFGEHLAVRDAEGVQ